MARSNERPNGKPFLYGRGMAAAVSIFFQLFGCGLAVSAASVAARTSAGEQAVRETRIVVASNVVLRVIETGDRADTPPIIFIPGWSAGADIWQGQIQRFKETNRVLAYDPRSQGQSTITWSGNTPEQRAADLRTLLLKKGARGAVLVGWSQAAQDIAAYAQLYGTADLSGIVLVDAAVSDGANAIKERPAEVAFQFKLFSTYLSSQEEYLRGMFQAIVSKPQPPGIIERAVATAMKTPASIGMSMLVSDMFTIDRRPALGQIECPVLIVAAANSRELQRQKDQVTKLRQATIIEIGDASHAVFLDQPDKFARALTDFLGNVRARSHP